MLYKGSLFNNKEADTQRLLQHGFAQSENSFAYSTTLMDGAFYLTVRISENGQVDAKVTDAASKEEYAPVHVPNACGGFVGALKEEYEAVLKNIAAKCFVVNIFKSTYAKNIMKYIKDTYNCEAEYLWEKFPNNAIFREKESAKWYAALLTVPKQKIGMNEDGDIEIIDLKSAPDAVRLLVDGINYLPGYHMNKKHWFTIRLEGSVPIEEIYRLIDISYATVKKR